MLIDAKRLRYYVVPLDIHAPDGESVVQSVYDSWYQVWKAVFSADNRDFEPDTDDFLRQNTVVAIFYENREPELVGFHLYSFFDLRQKLRGKHSYFQGVTADSFQSLKNRDLNCVMSMEYLTVMPKFRKQVSQIPWGEVIIALGLKYMQTTSGDTAFGTARRDVKVDNMASKLGFENLQESIFKYDYECAVITCPKSRICDHPDAPTNNLIQQLWNERIDFRETQPVPTWLKKAG